MFNHCVHYLYRQEDRAVLLRLRPHRAYYPPRRSALMFRCTEVGQVGTPVGKPDSGIVATRPSTCAPPRQPSWLRSGDTSISAHNRNSNVSEARLSVAAVPLSRSRPSREGVWSRTAPCEHWSRALASIAFSSGDTCSPRPCCVRETSSVSGRSRRSLFQLKILRHCCFSSICGCSTLSLLAWFVWVFVAGGRG